MRIENEWSFGDADVYFDYLAKGYTLGKMINNLNY